MSIFKYLFVFMIAMPALAQDNPLIGFEELVVSAEENVQLIIDAKKLTAAEDIPHSIYLPEGIFIEAKGIEDDKVVYAVFNDLVDIYNNGETAFWEEIESEYDLGSARLHYVNHETQNPTLGINYNNQSNFVASLILIPESTNDAVMSFNAVDGSLISMNFIPSDPTNIPLPIEALLTPNATILVSDQNSDQITEYDTSGVFVRILFGGNTAILDNCRGIELRPGTNTVVAAIAGGANQDAIAEFDLTTGNHIGNFIAPNAAQMDGPWDIIFRSTDCLVPGQASNNIVRYDLSGNYLGVFVPSINFPEQIDETINGDILAAAFSTPSGLYIYDSIGTQLNYFSTVSGLRGVYQLGNGNYLVTNGSGVYVLDQNTGAVLSTPVSGVSARSAREYDLSIVPVELTSFTANVIGSSIVLNWQTATELNNSGFQVERSPDGESFTQIAFVPGHGTTTEPKSYGYTDNSIVSGIYYYRLKQIDFDGSYTYSDVVETDLGSPARFALEQNYPNPFNPSTTIQFFIPVDSKVTISVYNLVGEKVSEVINKDYSAGSYSVSFDGSELPSGMYLYQLISGDYIQSRKMILMK